MNAFLPKGLLAAFFAAVLALAGGDARAADECGDVVQTSTPPYTNTCSNQAYTSGIRYLGETNAITLTVTGGAATTITSPTSGSRASGVVVGATGTGSRAIALTVGSGTNRVVIAQGTNTLTGYDDNAGILIEQSGAGDNPTTLIVGSGVDIGSSGTRMKNQGISLLVFNSANTGLQTIRSAADIFATTSGIRIQNRGSGNVAITNTGAIDSSGAGIRNWNQGATPGSGRTTASRTTIANSGSITAAGASSGGIWVNAYARGLYKVVHSGGSITTSGDNSAGIRIDATVHGGATPAENDRVEVEMTGGTIRTTGANSYGINVATAADPAGTSGHIRVRTTGGTITTTDATSYGIYVLHDVDVNAATAEITNAAAINSASVGILMDARSAGTVTVANKGAITIGTDGTGTAEAILVRDFYHNLNPDGDIATDDQRYGGRDRIATTETTVTNSGVIRTAGHGVMVDAYGLGSWRVVHGVAGEDGSVAGAITVTGANAYGIFVNADYMTGAPDTGEDPANAVTVTSRGAITASGTNGIGILVWNAAASRMVTAAERGLTGAAAADVDPVADAMVGGSISVTNSGAIAAKQYAIYVDTESPGAISVTNSGPLKVDGANTATSAAEFGTGILAVDAGSGNISVMNSADIDAQWRGVFARQTGSAGNVSVMHDAGNIQATERTGITALISGAANAGAVEVGVTGGSVRASQTLHEVAVHAATSGTGSVSVNVGRGAELWAKNNVGVFAVINDNDNDNANNTTGRISVSQGGEITADGGVYALATPASTAARAMTAQPLIDVTWTGTFTPHEREMDDVPSARSMVHAQALDHEAAVRTALGRLDGKPGILAEVMSWRTASYHIATADRPAVLVPASTSEEHVGAARTAATEILDAMDDDEDMTNYNLKTAILPGVRSALMEDARTIPGVDLSAIDTDGTAGLSDAEIVAWLRPLDDRHTIMANALGLALSDAETKVLQAVATGEGLDTALGALGSNLPDGYAAQVRTLASAYNGGNIHIAVNGGSIRSDSDGVRARFFREDNRNGEISVTVAQGARVTGADDGIYVANAGSRAVEADSDWGRALRLNPLDPVLNIRRQFVTVHGTVTGGGDAAVHLSGGGALIVGPTGKVLAGDSGRAVLVNDPGPARLVVDGEIKGGEGAPAAVHLTGGGTVLVSPTGSVQANGAMRAIRGGEQTGQTVTVTVQTEETIGSLNQVTALAAFQDRVTGGIGTEDAWRVQEIDDMGVTGHSQTVPTDEDGNPNVSSFPPPPPAVDPDDPDAPMAPVTPPAGPTQRPATVFECDLANTVDRRCGLYEALPSALASMNALPSYDDRLSAARSANGGWARVEGSSGEWKAESATQSGRNMNVAYDLRRHGFRGGVDIVAGEQLRIGVSAHHVSGNAKTDGMGEIDLTGSGAGVNATLTGDGFYADLQAAVTWFEADVTGLRGPLASGAEGTGYAAALEAGRRIDVSEAVAVIPRAGLSWSDASLDAFTDSVGSGVLVSVDEAQSLTGRIGARVETAPAGMDGLRVFGSLDVSSLLSQDAAARVQNEMLKTTTEETGFRAGVGAYATLADNVSLQGAAHYEASGGDNSSFGGALSLALRF